MGIVQIIGTDTYQIDATAGVVAKLGVGIAPTARLTLAAGTTNAGTAPLKLTTGAALASIEDGAMEYHSSHLYFSIGAARYQLDQQGGGSISSTFVYENTSTTTTSATFTLLSAMAITPGAGTYAIFASGTNESIANAHFALFANNSQITGSEVFLQNTVSCFALSAVATVSAGQTIQVRWHSESGDTITCTYRQMLLLKIS